MIEKQLKIICKLINQNLDCFEIGKGLIVVEDRNTSNTLIIRFFFKNVLLMEFTCKTFIKTDTTMDIEEEMYESILEWLIFNDIKKIIESKGIEI
mgnify:FL=1